MKITILCNDVSHPVNRWLQLWVKDRQASHSIEVVRDKVDASGGDILFLVSCNQMVTQEDRKKYQSTLVIHASNLPKGRGWSPHIWQILDGAQELIVSLLEAEEKVDSGRIWKKLKLRIATTWLYDEINNALFEAELKLMDFAVENFNTIIPVEQDSGIEPTYYPKRVPNDSRIDPEQSIAAQFDKIRVSDPDRFPAFFEFRGRRYRVVVERS